MIENTAPTGLVTDEHKTLFRRERYMILDRVIPENVLQMLREECSDFLGYCDAQIDPGLETSNINYRDKRYFFSNRYRLSLHMHPFIFGPLMAGIARATLGPEAHLFNEQWVVKGAEQGMSFSWHQDSGYVNFYGGLRDHEPFLTCWCPLDDVSERYGLRAPSLQEWHPRHLCRS